MIEKALVKTLEQDDEITVDTPWNRVSQRLIGKEGNTHPIQWMAKKQPIFSGCFSFVNTMWACLATGVVTGHKWELTFVGVSVAITILFYLICFPCIAQRFSALCRKAFPKWSLSGLSVVSATLVHMIGDDGSSDSMSFVDTTLRFARIEQKLRETEMNVLETIVIRRRRRSTVSVLECASTYRVSGGDVASSELGSG